MAALRVRDDGIGIAQHMLPRIFELFVQVDHTFTKAQGGLGIGLTLVRSLVEMHNRIVQVRSEGLGKGCEFVVRPSRLWHSRLNGMTVPKPDSKATVALNHPAIAYWS